MYLKRLPTILATTKSSYSAHEATITSNNNKPRRGSAAISTIAKGSLLPLSIPKYAVREGTGGVFIRAATACSPRPHHRVRITVLSAAGRHVSYTPDEIRSPPGP